MVCTKKDAPLARNNRLVTMNDPRMKAEHMDAERPVELNLLELVNNRPRTGESEENCTGMQCPRPL